MTITYPPEMLPGPDEDGVQVIVCCGADCCKAEIERLRAALEEACRIALGADMDWRSVNQIIELRSHQQSTTQRCPKCNSENWPSVNFKDGKPYDYCVDCGHEQR